MKAPEKLRAWRKRLDLTQTECAAHVKASQGTWNHWEAGKKKPDVDHAVAIENLTEGEVAARDWADTPGLAKGLVTSAKGAPPRRKAVAS